MANPGNHVSAWQRSDLRIARRRRETARRQIFGEELPPGVHEAGDDSCQLFPRRSAGRFEEITHGVIAALRLQRAPRSLLSVPMLGRARASERATTCARSEIDRTARLNRSDNWRLISSGTDPIRDHDDCA